tara:strand:+ start:27705 stop:28634 length:930 start_codon:yes stop_codon:yes gene_type:complete
LSTSIERLQGDAWQEWGNQLLTQHYGPAEYQRIPERHKGDAGIEGFTITQGHVYQQYGCEEPLSTQQRYEKQRDKMTRDVKKLIDNNEILSRIFGTTKITRWVLFVPFCDSKELVAHAATKTDEVKIANLSYVALDFRVMVADEEDFKTERAILLSVTDAALHISVESATPEAVAGWAADNDELVEVLDGKIAKLPLLTSTQQRFGFRNQVLKWYMEGQEMLSVLRKYPTTFERVIKAKSHRENYLASLTLNAATPADQFKAALEQLLETYREQVKEMSNLSAEALAHEAVADWLIRCPLDFSETGTDG